MMSLASLWQKHGYLYYFVKWQTQKIDFRQWDPAYI